ncbi:MAG: hypothetical protein FWE47_03020 [Oscillospiraceae bacterium]|nr:hypothetical protein [Oscillospiraceae bacterium]
MESNKLGKISFWLAAVPFGLVLLLELIFVLTGSVGWHVLMVIGAYYSLFPLFIITPIILGIISLKKERKKRLALFGILISVIPIILFFAFQFYMWSILINDLI